jgi:folate-binding protein YgfZ
MTFSPTASGALPVTGEIAGQSVALHYGEVAGEYAALRGGAMLVDRSARGRMRVSGARAREMIAGLVTNDVASLEPGMGQYAAALTPKGKIVADVRIFAHEDHLLIDVPPRAYLGWQAMVRKYINPRVAPYRDESSSLRDLGIFGQTARDIVASMTGIAADTLAALAPYAHMPAEIDGHPVLVVRAPDLELEGYELIIPADTVDDVWRRAVVAGATPGGLLAWEIARIEAGRPEWGLDIDDSTIPQEANFDELHAISYTKGCYVGQEVVARVHFRGRVNRHLRGLLFAQGPLPPTGAALVAGDDKPVGEVRSSALSPRLGGIALAMVRREVELGAAVHVRWDGGEARADVLQLPFPL